jgi:hypothetical protein
MLHNIKESVDKDGNITITGSTFQNPHVVAALVGTKSVTCETKAVGEELQFTLKLGVTKSIHDTKPSAPPANTVAVAPDKPAPPKADVVHPEPVIAPSKPGTQAPIPAQPEKTKTA